MNYGLYKFCLPKRTANPLKARASLFFLSILQPQHGAGTSEAFTEHSLGGVGIGTGPQAPLRLAMLNVWVTEHALDCMELAWPLPGASRKTYKLGMESELARTSGGDWLAQPHPPS